MASGFKPDNDIYTVLVGVASIMVITATIFLISKSNTLFGTWLP